MHATFVSRRGVRDERWTSTTGTPTAVPHRVNTKKSTATTAKGPKVVEGGTHRSTRPSTAGGTPRTSSPRRRWSGSSARASCSVGPTPGSTSGWSRWLRAPGGHTDVATIDWNEQETVYPDEQFRASIRAGEFRPVRPAADIKSKAAIVAAAREFVQMHADSGTLDVPVGGEESAVETVGDVQDALRLLDTEVAPLVPPRRARRRGRGSRRGARRAHGEKKKERQP